MQALAAWTNCHNLHHFLILPSGQAGSGFYPTTLAALSEAPPRCAKSWWSVKTSCFAVRLSFPLRDILGGFLDVVFGKRKVNSTSTWFSAELLELITKTNYLNQM